MTLRERLHGIGPYASLILVLVPLLIVEPLKVLALFIAGKGHWLGGVTCLVIAYAASLLIVDRLFRLLKPNMMRSPWLAKVIWWMDRVRSRSLQGLRKLTQSVRP